MLAAGQEGGAPAGGLPEGMLPKGVAPEHRSNVTVGVANNPDAARAGRLAVEAARANAPEGAPVCALLFSTSRHDPKELLASVRAALPEGVPVYGGYAVGIIDAETLGYDGFQVGVALFWLVGAELEVIVGRGLNVDEAGVGRELIQQLSSRSFRGTPSLLLLYDSVNRTGNHFQFNMATSIIEGSLSRLPDEVTLVGAGLVGDMQCRSTHQWTGEAVEDQTALLLAFSGGVEIEQVVLHGCRPASAYHEITRTDGNVVLEIDRRPALEVIAELLGSQSGRTWRDYAFFVTLGVNKGDKFAAFDPEVYANRMCSGVDQERGGLVMFEPDLREGDQVQLMLRDVDYSYIGDSIRANLERNAPRRPIFALYIDCAGRASAYSHLDQEEATFVQAALKDICPLLGFYSGVELARVAGRPQALDWTGVLCLFYEREVSSEPTSLVLSAGPSQPRPLERLAAQPQIDDLQAELAYYRHKLDLAAGEQVRFDAHTSAMRQRMRQREEGFRVLANLRRTIDVKRSRHEIFRDALGMVLANTGIDRAVVVESEPDGEARVVAAAGYSEEEVVAMAGSRIAIPAELEQAGFLIANKRDKLAPLEALRANLGLPFFLAAPIDAAPRRTALVVGRHREMKPFYPPFDENDVANFQAIANFLSSVVDNVQLFGDTEAMAASFRRFVPEAFLTILNRTDFKNIALGDQQARHMAVLVTDIRSFSTLSERMTPDEVFGFVNEFLAEVGPVVRDHKGFVNKYIGDAVMALFEENGHGLDAAVALVRQIEVLNDRRRLQKKFPIQIGAAVHGGDLMLGMIGEAERLEAGVLADAVNLCFRIEGLTKVYGAQILTTDATLAKLPDAGKYNVRPIDLVTVKGRRNHVTVLEILDGLPADRLEAKLETRELYTAGFQSFEFGAYEEAARTFREVAKRDPDDRAARAMAQKARQLAEGDQKLD